MSANSEAREAREQSIIQGADYFTVVRYHGPGKGYERHERPSLRDAIALGTELMTQTGKDYIIYAVKGVHDTYVQGVKAPRNMRNRDGAKEQTTSKRRVPRGTLR